jgi:hypothetical protein
MYGNWYLKCWVMVNLILDIRTWQTDIICIILCCRLLPISVENFRCGMCVFNKYLFMWRKIFISKLDIHITKNCFLFSFLRIFFLTWYRHFNNKCWGYTSCMGPNEIAPLNEMIRSCKCFAHVSKIPTTHITLWAF